jgi:NAD(P)-dependent dehydrogenase (short-subunit alcohol dehydrogenase family)
MLAWDETLRFEVENRRALGDAVSEGESSAVFLTGAGGGIGPATTQALAQRGFEVYAGVRQPTTELAGLPGVHQVVVDVTDPASVAAAADEVNRLRGGRGLHAVINNAGVIVQGPVELAPVADLPRQFEVNVYGSVYVVQSFLPLLRAVPGRLINISAPSARVAVPFMASISASKAALDLFSASLRVEQAPFGIPVSIVEPGTTATEIFAKAGTAAQAALGKAAPEVVALYRDRLDGITQRMGRFRSGPVAAVARTIVAAVEARRPKVRYTVGDARQFGILTKLPTAPAIG